MLLGIFDWIADFFKSLFDLIPKVIYLLYASLACVIDVLQLFFRKLAGLDVYYVDGEAVAGDLVTNFITGILGINPNGFEYSALSTVFWAFIVFGIIICFISTIVAIVKSHYSYDDKAAKGPMQYVFTAGKAVLNMVAVPIIVVLGLYLSQAILTALDSMTSITSGNIVSMYGDKVDLLEQVDTSKTATGIEASTEKNKTYIYYDIFGFGGAILYGTDTYNEGDPVWEVSLPHLALIGSSNQTFSGSLFKVAAYNANRVRTTGSMNMSGFLDGELFSNAATANDTDLGADMIDTAFACNLHLKEPMQLRNDLNGGWASAKYFTNFLCPGVSAFSKFNVGAIWYYYDLWNFNFIVGFAACIVCTTLFINIIMGLIARLFMCIGLFLVAPPLFGLAPLDGGKAGNSWRENFMKQVLMAYGAVVGMNIFFLILPYMNEIDFFNIPIADYFAQSLVIIVGLVTIKAFIATLSGLIGGADANETGKGIAEEVGAVAGTATKMTVGAAKMGAKVWGGVAGGVARGVGFVGHQVNRIPVVNRATSAIGRGAHAVANSRFGRGVSRAVHGVASLKDRITGKRNLDAANADVNAMKNFDAENKLMRGLEGTDSADFDADAFRIQAQQAGFNGDRLNDIVNAARATAARGGTMNMANLQADMVANNSAYAAGNAAGWNNETRFRNEMIRREARVRTSQGVYDRRIKRATGIRDMALTPFKNVDSVMGESKLYSTFKEKSFWGKTDWQKETAENTRKTFEELQAGRGDLRQGFETMHGDAGEIIRQQGGTNNQLAEVNAHLGNVEQDTHLTRMAAQRISRETDGMKARQKKALKQNEQAHRDLENAKDKLDVLVRDSKNRRRPRI